MRKFYIFKAPQIRIFGLLYQQCCRYYDNDVVKCDAFTISYSHASRRRKTLFLNDFTLSSFLWARLSNRIHLETDETSVACFFLVYSLWPSCLGARRLTKAKCIVSDSSLSRSAQGQLRGNDVFFLKDLALTNRNFGTKLFAAPLALGRTHPKMQSLSSNEPRLLKPNDNGVLFPVFRLPVQPSRWQLDVSQNIRFRASPKWTWYEDSEDNSLAS